MPVDAEPWPTDRAARVSVNSFGIGGANAHVSQPEGFASHLLTYSQVIIDGWVEHELDSGHGSLDEEITPSSDEQYHLLLFSAKSKESVDSSISNHQRYINDIPVRLQDLSHTLASRREHLPYRAFALTNNLSNLETTPVELTGGVPKVVYIFTGQGAQWPQMGRRLLQVNSAFRQSIRELDESLKGVAPELTWTIEGI